jgi:methyl-accepting chemotaxis protein/methyl-accepting chemotaxis protein-1 (serine sensor receptor)
MTFGKRLGLSLGASLLLTLVLGSTAWVYLSSLRDQVDAALGVEARKADLINEIRRNILGFRFGERGILLFTAANGAQKVQTSKEAFSTSMGQVTALIDELRPSLIAENDRQLVDEVSAAVKEYAGIQAQIPGMCASGRLKEALKIDMEQLVGPGSRALKAADSLRTRERIVQDDARIKASATLRSARSIVAVILILYVLIAGAAALVTTRGTRTMRSAVKNLLKSFERIRDAAARVSTGSDSLARDGAENAASLQQSAAGVEEITALASSNAERAHSAASLMDTVDRDVRRGNSTLEEMVLSMREIGESSDKVSKIIRVIEEIAFQTNILALNAAVEAARAGEAGLGFAVVASEVRSLAQRSAQAAQDTSALIEESIHRSSQGRTKLQGVSEVMGAITQSTSKIKAIVDEMNVGSQEEARGTQQISKALAQMNRMVQKSAATAQHGASASDELHRDADELDRVVMELGALMGVGA